MINVGALVGQIAMVFAERFVGYWLAFTLPTLMFLIAPLVLLGCRKKYYRRPATGSVLSKALRLIWFGLKQSRGKNLTTGARQQEIGFWDRVKPSNVAEKPSWMTFDDAWVDEVRRGLQACKVFLWYPIYWLSYSQMINNLVSQAATLERNGVPNDIINNIDPLALIIFIPIFDQVVYPALARYNIRFTPIRRITAGFWCGSLAMIVACITQHYIYKESRKFSLIIVPSQSFNTNIQTACGNHAGACPHDQPAPITVWVQIPAYLLIAFSEIFASITGLEYAFTKAPKNMRSMVTAIFLFMSAISSAIAQAFVGLSADPLLPWLYATIAILAFLAGTGFWIVHRKLDRDEERLNALPESHYKGRNKGQQSIAEEGGEKR